MKVMTILGVRPQFIKHKVMSGALWKRGHTDIIVHTGQHYDDDMMSLALPKLDYHLDLRKEEISRAVSKLAYYIWVDKPDYVVVYGDAKSTYLGAHAAVKTGTPLVHIEAGLRSHDPRMKEELYRRVVDHMSDYLFAPTESAVKNLKEEEVPGKIYNSGDVMREALKWYEKFAPTPINEGYIFMTLHRAELVDNELALVRAIDRVEQISFDRQLKVIWPCHPRTKKMMAKFNIRCHPEWELIPPVNYLKCIGYQKHADLVITDSGGVQRESKWLGTECKVFRDETEWHEIDEGQIEKPSAFILDTLEGEL